MKIKDGFYMTEIGSDYVIIAGTPEAKNCLAACSG